MSTTILLLILSGELFLLSLIILVVLVVKAKKREALEQTIVKNMLKKMQANKDNLQISIQSWLEKSVGLQGKALETTTHQIIDSQSGFVKTLLKAFRDRNETSFKAIHPALIQYADVWMTVTPLSEPEKSSDEILPDDVPDISDSQQPEQSESSPVPEPVLESEPEPVAPAPESQPEPETADANNITQNISPEQLDSLMDSVHAAEASEIKSENTDLPNDEDIEVDILDELTNDNDEKIEPSDILIDDINISEEENLFDEDIRRG